MPRLRMAPGVAARRFVIRLSRLVSPLPLTGRNTDAGSTRHTPHAQLTRSLCAPSHTTLNLSELITRRESHRVL